MLCSESMAAPCIVESSGEYVRSVLRGRRRLPSNVVLPVARVLRKTNIGRLASNWLHAWADLKWPCRNQTGICIIGISICIRLTGAPSLVIASPLLSSPLLFMVPRFVLNRFSVSVNGFLRDLFPFSVLVWSVDHSLHLARHRRTFL